MFKGLLQSSVLAGHKRVVHNSREGDTKQALFLCVLLPDLTEVWEVGVGRLDSPKDGCQTYLLREGVNGVGGSYYNLCQITELVRAQDNL